MAPRRPLPPILNEPLPLPPRFSVGMHLLDPQEEARHRKLMQEWYTENGLLFIEKIVALAEHYGARPDGADIDFMKLALALAKDYVPGFRTAERGAKRGRPGKWRGTGEATLRGWHLAFEVAALVDDGVSEMKACRQLAAARGETAATLHRRLKEVQQAWPCINGLATRTGVSSARTAEIIAEGLAELGDQ